MNIDIIGGGYAGCAAAWHLLNSGHHIRLWEQRAVLGGRARRLSEDIPHDGSIAIDNGQHLIAGAYHTLLSLIKQAHAPHHAPLLRLPLQFFFAGEQTAWLRLPKLPSPLNLLYGIFNIRWSLIERLRAVYVLYQLNLSDFQAKHPTVHLLERYHPKLYQQLIEPLCLGILNTSPEEACTKRLALILKTLFTQQKNTDAIIAQTDLSSLFPEAVAQKLTTHHHEIYYKSCVQSIEPTEQGWLIFTSTQGQIESDAIILATAPDQLPKLLKNLLNLPEAMKLKTWLEQLEYSPIATVYFENNQLPFFKYPMLQLKNSPAQWIFERHHSLMNPSHHYAVVISAATNWLPLSNEQRLEQLEKQLATEFKIPQLLLKNTQIIIEKRATYCTKALMPNPSKTTLGHRLYVAGDYLDPILPATLEAAVQSGIKSAEECLLSLNQEARCVKF
jgi:hydroxysqualene dehydroxylase